MFNLCRYATLSHVVKNFGVTKKLFASTSVLAEKKEAAEPTKEHSVKKLKNPTIAAVFASLNENEITASESSKDSKPQLDEIINNAKTVNGLLTIAETQQDIGRKHALKIVSILAEWSSINRVKLNEFENDVRFTKLCRMLGRTVNLKNGNGNGTNTNYRSAKKIASFQTDDLNVVLGVTGDDEAAKLVATITLPQMVKVMKSLAMKKRRSTPLLRSLAFNISSKEHQLDIKQCGDVLYSMSVLNFPDPLLISKVCDDIQEEIKKPLDKPAIVGSIITSLAFLKYREPHVIDTLVDWMLKNQDICRTQDISALFMSLALLNHLPTEMEVMLKTKMATSLTSLDFKTQFDYLGYVWSLMVLNFPSQDFFNSVLQQEFIDSLIRESPDQELPVTAKMKLLNINAGVKLFLPTYSGSMLSRDKHRDVYDVPMMHNKEKQLIVNGMIDAVKSLVPENCLRLNQDSSMGFVIDAEFFVDEKGNPTTQETTNGKRIALMVQDFRDMCQGSHQHVNGITALSLHLLSKAGYEVISVPYHEFSISDKLLKRVQYLEKAIKAINKK